MQKSRKNHKAVRNLCLTAMLMALNVAFCTVSIPVPGGHLYMCDIVICTASILLNPLSAFAVGGVGALIGDLFFNPDAMYVSLLSHGVQAILISLFSHTVCKKYEKRALWSGIGVTLGAIVMVIGYTLGRAFVYRTPEYAILKLPYEILQAALGAAVAMILCYKCGLVKLYNKQMNR